MDLEKQAIYTTADAVRYIRETKRNVTWLQHSEVFCKIYLMLCRVSAQRNFIIDFSFLK